MTILESEQIREVIETFRAELKEYRRLTIELIACIKQLRAENRELRAAK